MHEIKSLTSEGRRKEERERRQWHTIKKKGGAWREGKEECRTDRRTKSVTKHLPKTQ